MPKPEITQVDKDFASLKNIQEKMTIDSKTFKTLHEAAKKFAEENQEKCKPVPRAFNRALWKGITNELIEENDLTKFWNSKRTNFDEETSFLWPDDKDNISFLIFCLLKFAIKNIPSNKRKSEGAGDDPDTPTPNSKRAKKTHDEDEDGMETPQTGKKAQKDMATDGDVPETPQAGKKAKKNQKGDKNGSETPQTGKKAKKSQQGDHDLPETPQTGKKTKKSQKGDKDGNDTPQMEKKAKQNSGVEQDVTQTPPPLDKTAEQAKEDEGDGVESPQADKGAEVAQAQEHDDSTLQTEKEAAASSKASDTNASDKDKIEDTIVVSTATPPVPKKKVGRPPKGTPFKVPKMTKKMQEEKDKEVEMQKHAEEYAKKQAATDAEDHDDEDLPEDIAAVPTSSTKAGTSEKPENGAKINGHAVKAVQATDEEMPANDLDGADAQAHVKNAKLALQSMLPEDSSDPAFPANDPSTPTPASTAKPNGTGTPALSIEGLDNLSTKVISENFDTGVQSLFGPRETPQASSGLPPNPYFIQPERERDLMTPTLSHRNSGSVFTDDVAPINISFVVTSKNHEQDPIHVSCMSNASFQHLFAEAQMISAGPARFGIGSTTCANLKIPGGAEVSIKFPDPELKKKWSGAMTMAVASVGDGNLHEGEEVMVHLT